MLFYGLGSRWGLTDNPEEGRDERDNGMPVCVLHTLESVFHRLYTRGTERRARTVGEMMTYLLYVYTNGKSEMKSVDQRSALSYCAGR